MRRRAFSALLISPLFFRPALAAPRRELIVFAAASLREVMQDLAAATPDVTVQLNLAGTQELRAQLEHGARAHLFVAADQKHMRTLVEQDLVEPPVTFARNELVVVVPKGSKTPLRSFAQLPTARRLVIGAPEVPIGAYTVAALEKANSTLGTDFSSQVLARVVSRELNVRQVLAKVALGEADAGVVYRTDARAAADKVDVIALPTASNVIAEYPVAIVRALPPADRDLTRAFRDRLLSAEGQRALTARGFLLPAPAAPP